MSFNDFVARSWNNNVPYPHAVSQFIDQVALWNKDYFGNIFHYKHRLLARLRGIQKALERYNSGSLIRLESSLKRELEEVLMQEDLLLRVDIETKLM